jgi:lipopolysaccharide-binding protein
MIFCSSIVFTIQYIAISDINVHVVQGTGLQVTITNIQFAAEAQWHYREHGFPHISDSGRVDVNTGIDIAILVHVSTDASGHLVINIDPNVGVNIHDFNIKLHGGASWLYNLIKGLFEGSIKHSVENVIRDQISGSLNAQLQKLISSINYQVQVGAHDANVFLDLSMSQAIFSATPPPSFGMGSKGLFYQQNGQEYAGPPPPVVPYRQLTSNTNMIQVIITDYVVNSLGWAWYQSGRLTKTLTDKDIPAQVPIRLNTKFFVTIAPELYQKYPDTAMQVTFNLSGNDFNKSPKGNLTSSGATITALGTAVFQVIQNDNPIEVFILDIVLNFELKVDVQGNLIVGSMQLDKLSLSLESSQVGNVDAQSLNMLLGTVVQYVLVPIVNAQLAQGFPIPTFNGITLAAAQIVFDDRFIGVASNFTFTPSHL